MSWLNEEASSNIATILVTCAVFQLPMSWLNVEPKNIHGMITTFSVFQLPMSPLNDEVQQNVHSMLVTDDVSQFEMSPLNVLLPPKPWYEDVSKCHPLISSTKLVSQFVIVP